MYACAIFLGRKANGKLHYGNPQDGARLEILNTNGYGMENMYACAIFLGRKAIAHVIPFAIQRLHSVNATSEDSVRANY